MSIYILYLSIFCVSLCVCPPKSPSSLYKNPQPHIWTVGDKKEILSLFRRKKVNIYNKVSRYKIDQLLFTLVYKGGDFYCVCIFIPHFFQFLRGKMRRAVTCAGYDFCAHQTCEASSTNMRSLKNKDIDRPRPPTMYIYRFRMNEIYTTIRC